MQYLGEFCIFLLFIKCVFVTQNSYIIAKHGMALGKANIEGSLNTLT